MKRRSPSQCNPIQNHHYQLSISPSKRRIRMKMMMKHPLPLLLIHLPPSSSIRVKTPFPPISVILLAISANSTTPPSASRSEMKGWWRRWGEDNLSC